MKNFDIIIVGGGAIGASCAFYLSKNKDLKIALVDMKKPGNASRASAGGLWAIGESVGLGCGVIFFKTLSKRMAECNTSLDEARLLPHILPEVFLDFAIKSNNLYPELYTELKENYAVDFKYQPSGLKFIAYDKHDILYAKKIESSIPHLAKNLTWLDKEQLIKSEPYVNRNAVGAMQIDCDHQVSPFKLVDAYIDAAKQNGITYYANTEVLDILKQDDQIQGIVTNRHQKLYCDTLINAAGAWANDICFKATGVNIPITPVKGQIILSEKLPKILNSSLSTADCYIAQKDNGELLIGSTTEYKGFNTETNFNDLKKLAQGAMLALPELKKFNLKRSWAGLRPGTPDELPILGHMSNVKGYINACGHFRTGILTSAITGEIVNALVRNMPTPVDIDSFSFNRFTLHHQKDSQFMS